MARRLARRRIRIPFRRQPLLGLQDKHRGQHPLPWRKLLFKRKQDPDRQLFQGGYKRPQQDCHQGRFFFQRNDKGQFVCKACHQDNVLGKAGYQDYVFRSQEFQRHFHQERQLQRLLYKERFGFRQQAFCLPFFHLFQPFIQDFRQQRNRHKEFRLIFQVLRRRDPQQRRKL